MLDSGNIDLISSRFAGLSVSRLDTMNWLELGSESVSRLDKILDRGDISIIRPRLVCVLVLRLDTMIKLGIVGLSVSRLDTMINSGLTSASVS